MKTTKDKIAVMQAYLDGKIIQMNQIGYTMWEDVHKEPVFDWSRHDYRIMPEKREGWVNMYYNEDCKKLDVLQHLGPYVYSSEELARQVASTDNPTKKVKQVKITWEE